MLPDVECVRFRMGMVFPYIGCVNKYGVFTVAIEG